METPASLARLLQVSEGTVHRWVRTGALQTVTDNGRCQLEDTEANRAFIIDRLTALQHRRPKAWVPEAIEDYNEWHHLIDEFVWLLKVCYSDRDDLKRKKFRLDALFVNYLRGYQVSLNGIRSTLASSNISPAGLVSDDLKRGWYNELAYAVPLKPSTLGLSFSDIELNKSFSTARFAFPSWRITTAYYSVYFYLRAVTLQKQPGFRLEQHGTTIASFKHGVVNALGRSIWRFPFDIAYVPGVRVLRKDLLIETIPQARHGYSSHPRAPNRTPKEIFDHILRRFRKRGRAGGKAAPYMLFDYLHDFRVWANYLDIDNLLQLWGPGYKTILDANLTALLFFIGGFAELCYMSVYSPAAYLRQLQQLYDLFAANNPELENTFPGMPLHQRLQIYNRMGLLKGKILLREKPDINQVMVGGSAGSEAGKGAVNTTVARKAAPKTST